jgi:hypothetical protein
MPKEQWLKAKDGPNREKVPIHFLPEVAGKCWQLQLARVGIKKRIRWVKQCFSDEADIALMQNWENIVGKGLTNPFIYHNRQNWKRYLHAILFLLHAQ